MSKKQTKKFYLNPIKKVLFNRVNILAILFCAIAVFAFGFFIKADSTAQIQFTEDTIVSLTGIITDGDLKIASSSECAGIVIDGADLTITGIPIANNFILKTELDGSPVHSNGLKLTPTGGVLDLILNSANVSSLGNITQWTLNGSSETTVAHIVGVSHANEYYNIKAGEILLGSYPSSASKEVNFTYSGDLSNEIFTIESSNDITAPVRTDGSPSTALSAGTTETILLLTTNETATCKYSTTAGTAYASMTAFSNTDNTTHSTPITELTNGTSYNYYIKCQDAVDNVNLSDYVISFSVSSAGGGIPFWMLNQINNANKTDGGEEDSSNSDGSENDSDGENDNNDKSGNDGVNNKADKNSKGKNLFAYSKARLKSLPQEQNSAKELKQKLEKSFGKGKIPVHRKYWHTIVNPYIYGNYPITAIIQAIKFKGKTVHPIIPFSAWKTAKDYLEWIGK